MPATLASFVMTLETLYHYYPLVREQPPPPHQQEQQQQQQQQQGSGDIAPTVSHTHIHTRTYTCTYTRTHTHIHTHTYTYAHTSIRKHINTHTYTHIGSSLHPALKLNISMLHSHSMCCSQREQISNWRADLVDQWPVSLMFNIVSPSFFLLL